MKTLRRDTPPIARKTPVVTHHHGIVRTDEYGWLRADNWQQVMRDPSCLAADIRDHLEAENAFAAAQMADQEPLRARLFEEMKGRIDPDESSVPAASGPWLYQSRYMAGQQYLQFVRRKARAPGAIRGPGCMDATGTDTGTADDADATGAGDDAQILLDGNVEARGLAYFSLASVRASPDHTHIAWSADTKGSERYTLRIRKAGGTADEATRIHDTSGSVQWSADSRFLFYVRLDEAHRPDRVFRHKTGTDPARDELVYRESDPGFFVSLGKSQSGRLIFVCTGNSETSEWHVLDAARPERAPWCLAPRQSGVQMSVDDNGERLFVLTNRDAEDFRIESAPLTQEGRMGAASELVAHQPGHLILDMVPGGTFLAYLERAAGLPRIHILDLSSHTSHTIDFAEPAYSLSLDAGLQMEQRALRFSCSSMKTPREVYDYDVIDRTRILKKRQSVPGGHNPRDYVTARLFASADDGEQIPVSILHHRRTPLDGTAPCLLYGYGAYGISIPAAFQTERLSLVDRGFVYAIAHIRGGKECGYRWFRLGRAAHKRNSFTDFIAVARHLQGKGLVARDRMVAEGGSAGGMLMGAIANMAPERFAGIIAQVPFVDVLATMLDAGLPLTPPEWPEWGNPIESVEDYRRIAGYSPVDNVTAQDYPPILALAGLTDPRVTYWEPAKWVARLRALKTGDAPVLLKTEMTAGHGGASGRFERLRDSALCQAFAIKCAAPECASPDQPPCTPLPAPVPPLYAPASPCRP